MNRRLVVVFGAIIAVFAISVVGASSLNLTGSDSAPAEGRTVASCTSDLVVRSVVDTSIPSSNSVIRVDISGDMTECVGEQMLVEIDIPGTTEAWATYTFTTPISSLSLTLDSSTGLFYDAKPTATLNVLQTNGDRMEPIPVADFGQVTVTIAKTWQ